MKIRLDFVTLVISFVDSEQPIGLVKERRSFNLFEWIRGNELLTNLQT